MKALEELLVNFQSVGLKEMESLGLMKRIDYKFVFHISQLPQILRDIMPHYTCLEIQGRKVNHYSTLYYDTPDYKFYRDHHRGKLNRFKIRRRNYTDSGIQFLEIKMKTNTGYTDKKRIPSTSNHPELDENEWNFIRKHLVPLPAGLFPKVRVDYDRMAFADIPSGERLSIDLNLSFRNKETSKDWKDLVIAELKTDRHKTSRFSQLMKDSRIPMIPFSKYCYAMALTEPGVIRNNFKEKLHFIQKHTKHVHFAK